MKFEKKKTLGLVSTTSLIMLTFVTVLGATSAPPLVVMSKPGPPGTYEIDIYGDASGLNMMCQMVNHFKASKLEWSTSMPSYPSGSVDFALDVRDVDFDKVNAWTYHLSVRGLEEGSFIASGYTNITFLVRARSGEVDFTFSNPSLDPWNPYYRNVTITGTLKGDVSFTIDIPPYVPAFYFEGPELTINVHVGM